MLVSLLPVLLSSWLVFSHEIVNLNSITEQNYFDYQKLEREGIADKYPEIFKDGKLTLSEYRTIEQQEDDDDYKQTQKIIRCFYHSDECDK